METVKAFIATFMSAVSNCTLYSKDHAAVDELTRKALSQLTELLQESDSLEMMLVGDDLIVNKTPLRDIGAQGVNLIKRLRRKGLSRVDFLKGITFSELIQFVADVSAPSQEPKTYTHLRTGVVDVRLGGFKLDADIDLDMDGLSGFASGQVEMVKDVYHGLTPFKKLNIAGLEEIVVNFILTFRREANILRLISPVKSFSEYTYTHATNVAVLSMFQAETLGVRDDLLRDIGISALLHDVGKLFIAKELLEKKDALNEMDWNEIRMHPVYGAKYLIKLEGLPRLASIVAIEHHRRFDGKGYPDCALNNKKQHLCSQTVAIADFFDALRSRRPYRKALEIKEVLALMRRDSGVAFNPVLLDNFMRSMHKAVSE
jgi:HD-GYP domain-containing protein (c-di-GMP phosphodiesterase class II)